MGGGRWNYGPLCIDCMLVKTDAWPQQKAIKQGFLMKWCMTILAGAFFDGLNRIPSHS